MRKNYNLYKWSIWTVLTLSMAIVYSHRLAMSVVANDISKELNLSASALGSLASATYYTYALMQVPVGILLDYIGPRKICFTGMFIAGMGSIIFGMSVNIYMAYFGRFLIGLGTSVISISIFKVQSRWFYPDEFSAATGKVAVIANLGAVFSTFPLAILVSSIGWRNSFYSLGLFTVVISYAIFLIVRNTPKEYGFKEIVELKDEKINIIHAIKSVTMNKSTWADFFILFSFVGCTTAFSGLWGIPYLISVFGLSSQKAAFYMSFMVYGFIGGGIISGGIARLFKNDHRRIIKYSTILTLIIWIYIVIIKGGKPQMQSIPVLLFIMGVLVISHIFAFTNVKEVNDIKYAGIAAGVINLGEFLGSSVISIFIGLMLDYRWSGRLSEGTKIYGIYEYKYALTIFLAMSAISVITAFFIKDTRQTVH